MQFTILRLWAFSCMNLWSVQFNASTERWGASWPYFTTIKQGRPELNFSSCVFCVADCLANKTICHQLMQKSTRILTSIYSNDWIKKNNPNNNFSYHFFPRFILINVWESLVCVFLPFMSACWHCDTTNHQIFVCEKKSKYFRIMMESLSNIDISLCRCAYSLDIGSEWGFVVEIYKHTYNVRRATEINICMDRG